MDPRPTILCVDDDPLTCTLLGEVLEQGGYDCTTVGSAVQAMGVLPWCLPDLILLDLNLPDLDGFELFASIRGTKGQANTPILILSSSSTQDDISLGLRLGAEDYLLKPVVPALLLAKIKVAFARHQQRTPAVTAQLSDSPHEVLAAAANPDNLIDKYVIVNEIGQGGMGVVSRAWDTTLDTWVALKFIRPGIDPVSIERFFREARIVVRLFHAHICRVLDLRSSGGRHYIAMQYIDGPNCDAKYDANTAASIIESICGAVHYAHGMGVVHRDIKPENLILDPSGKAWITDFGISASETITKVSKKLTPTGLIVGSLAYMAPEYLTSGKADAQTEVYSLGATLYHLLVGEPPYFDTETREVLDKIADQQLPTPPSRLDPEIPAELERILYRALDHDLDLRYRDAAELATDLRSFLQGSGWLQRMLGRNAR